jgi:hypothetical protein
VLLVAPGDGALPAGEPRLVEHDILLDTAAARGGEPFVSRLPPDVTGTLGVERVFLQPVLGIGLIRAGDDLALILAAALRKRT